MFVMQTLTLNYSNRFDKNFRAGLMPGGHTGVSERHGPTAPAGCKAVYCLEIASNLAKARRDLCNRAARAGYQRPPQVHNPPYKEFLYQSRVRRMPSSNEYCGA